MSSYQLERAAQRRVPIIRLIRHMWKVIQDKHHPKKDQTLIRLEMKLLLRLPAEEQDLLMTSVLEGKNYLSGIRKRSHVIAKSLDKTLLKSDIRCLCEFCPKYQN